MLYAVVLLLQVLASLPQLLVVDGAQWSQHGNQPSRHHSQQQQQQPYQPPTELAAIVAVVGTPPQAQYRRSQQQQQQQQQRSQHARDTGLVLGGVDYTQQLLISSLLPLYNHSLPNVSPVVLSAEAATLDQQQQPQQQQQPPPQHGLSVSLPSPQYLPRISNKRRRVHKSHGPKTTHKQQQQVFHNNSSSSPLSNLTSLTKMFLRGATNEIDLDRTAPDTTAGFFTKTLENLGRLLPPMRIGHRQHPGCVGGTKCQFFVFCWMTGGSVGASCGPLHTCCVTPSSQDIQPQYWGPVVNDPQCGKSAARISRIVGGTDATFGQFPWQAFVQVGGSRCGGALVGPAHVVTAGHCVARSAHDPSSIKVNLGDYILNSEIESLSHELFTVSEVKLHPNFRFTPQADRYDVAVLVLDRSVQYRENIMPICLPPKGASYLGRLAYVAGWGALQAGSKLRPKVLQHVPVPVVENPICEGWHKQRGINIKIYDEMLCAGYESGGKDACQGDSGGPLMLNEFGVWYLIGIVSAGYSCAKQYQPGIYHRLSSSSDWVSANVFPQSARYPTSSP